MKKLTEKQNAVLWCLQNGWVLITDSSVKGAWVGSSTSQYHIGSRLFFNLVELGYIYQGDWKTHNYNYVLTQKGKDVKTKPVTI